MVCSREPLNCKACLEDTRISLHRERVKAETQIPFLWDQGNGKKEGMGEEKKQILGM